MDVSTDEGAPESGSPILVQTKLFPPQPAGRTLARERLIELLRQGSGGHRLTLIAAPGGYGKTMLLSSWVDSEKERSVAWVSLDDRDDDPVVLWAHIIASLRHVSSGPCRALSPELARAASLGEVAIPRLINALAGEDEISLVLDDFHHLGARAAKESIAWFVSHAPRNLQVVISTRSEPDLPLPALRVHGDLLEIRAEDLRFTDDEAAELINDEFGLELSSEDLTTLMWRTEGWPAGIYLAALSIPRAADPHEFVARFGASSRFVAEFLVAEVLDTYGPDVQDFMLRASVLDDLSGALCDAVLGTDGSAALLQRLARSNLFLVRLDDEGTWYRFHRLFSQLLQVELERREPGASASLHRRAFRWFLAGGWNEEAIEHALEAGAFDEATDVIASTWPVLVNAGKHATVTGWIGRLPETHRDDVRLRLAKAWSLSMSGRREEARRGVDAIEARPEARDVPLVDGCSSVTSSLTLLRAVFPDGDHGAGLRAARQAVGLVTEGSPWRAVACSAVGRDSYYAMEFEEADRWLAESCALAPAAGQWITAVTALAYRSLTAGVRGRDTDRRALAEQASRLSRDHGLDTVAGPPHLAAASASLEHAHVEQARAQAEEGLVVLRRWGQPLQLAHALLLLTQISRMLGDSGAAASSLDEARAVLQGCPDPGILLASWLSELTTSSSSRHKETATDDLTERELVVLQLLRGSLSKREIGQELFVTLNTVHSHTRSIYRKLGVSSRAEAVEAARSRGLL